MVSFLSKQTDDAALIAGLKTGGSERRLQENKLFETFYYFIRQGMKKYNISEEGAASAYSDTIISVIHNITTNKFEGRSSLKSYTYQIFSNKCVDFIRKETTNKQGVHATTALDSLVTDLPDKSRGIVQDLIKKSEWLFLMEKLKEVGEKCKQLLLLFEDGYSDKEIAVMMHYNSGEVVKTSRLRCIEKLREKVITERNRNL